MKYALESGSVAVIYTYMPSFIKICSGIQKLIGRQTDKQRGWISHKPTLGKVAK
jgi:hypothetical protein